MGGGTEDIEVVGSDDEDDVMEDFGELQEENEDHEIFVYQETEAKVIDSLELKTEAERVSTKLEIRISATKTDWRGHFASMNQHRQKMDQIMVKLSPILLKVGADISKAIEAIETRENNLNSKFDSSVQDYSRKAGGLVGIEEKYKQRLAEVNALEAEMKLTVEKLKTTQEKLKDAQDDVADNSPIKLMKNAIATLRKEINSLELRSAILQRSLSQAWLEESLMDGNEHDEDMEDDSDLE